MIKAIFILLVALVSSALQAEPVILGPNYVNVKSVNVRELPDPTSKIVGKLIFRQKAYVDEIKGGWARIASYTQILREGQQVKISEWVSVKYLVKEQPEPPAEPEKAKIDSSKLISEQLVRSMQGDKGRYFLLYVERKGTNFIAINSRIGVYDTVYTKTEINCQQKQFRVLGESYSSIDEINNLMSKWSDLVSGSSKSDLVHYVCATKKHLK